MLEVFTEDFSVKSQRKMVIEHLMNNEINMDNWTDLDILPDDESNRFVTLIKCTHKPDNNRFGQSVFLTHVVSKEDIKLPSNLQNKFISFTGKLHMPEEIKSNVYDLLLGLYTSNINQELQVSMSNDNEFLVYTLQDGAYKNMLINEDGDVELLFIPSDKSESYNKTFYKEDEFKNSTVVDTFNEMR